MCNVHKYIDVSVNIKVLCTADLSTVDLVKGDILFLSGVGGKNYVHIYK